MNRSILVVALLTATALLGCNKAQDAGNAPPAAATPPSSPAPEVSPTPAPAAAPAASEPAPAAESVAPAEPKPEATNNEAAPAAKGVALSVDEGKALAKKSGCFACHNIEKKIIGPAWNDVGKKYKDNPDAHANLVKWVHIGGTGRWGTAVMPPYSPRVPDEDIEKLATFILSLPK